GLDVDHRSGEDFRVVQLTPPGSACSIALMRNTSAPGSLQGLHLVVPDIEAARAELLARGVDAGEIFHFGAGGQTPGPDPQRSSRSTCPRTGPSSACATSAYDPRRSPWR